MLVLSRKKHEKLLIGNNVVIQPLGTKGNQIRLGIIAPPEVTILREEVYRRINKNAEANSFDAVTS